MTTTSPSTTRTATPDPRRSATILIVGVLAVVFDSTIMSVALNTLSNELHAPLDVIQWVTTAYVLALAASVPISVWLQRFLGGKNSWLLALGLFTLGSVLCSLSWNVESLITFRVIQGIGGGIMMPLMMSIIMQAAGGKNLGRLAATVGLPAILGPVLGPAIGGIILNWLDWQWLFLVNIPFCVTGLLLAWFKLAPERGDRRARLDAVGLVLLTGALVAVLIGLTNSTGDEGFGALDAWLPLAAGLVLSTAFVIHALRAGDRAIVDIRLLAKRSVWSSSVLLLLSGVAAYGIMLLLPLALQNVRGYDVLAAGLFMIPQGLGTLLARPLAGRLVDSVGARWVAIVGFLIIAVATVPFATSSADTNEWFLMGALLVRGIGLGGLVLPLMVAPMQHLSKQEIPHVSVITRIAQQLGGSFGTAVLAVVLQTALVSAAAENTPDPSAAFDQAFWWSIGFTALGTVLCLCLPGRRPAERA